MSDITIKSGRHYFLTLFYFNNPRSIAILLEDEKDQNITQQNKYICQYYNTYWNIRPPKALIKTAHNETRKKEKSENKLNYFLLFFLFFRSGSSF